jgi:hypothetical protein
MHLATRTIKVAVVAVLALLAIFFLAVLLDVPHHIWHYFDNKRIAQRQSLMKQVGEITAKMTRYMDTTEAIAPESFVGFQQVGVLSAVDMQFLTSHAAILYPFRRETPTNSVVVELADTGIVGLREGVGTLKRYVKER